MSIQSLLRQLHTLHLQIHDLRAEAEEGPRQLRRYQAQIEQRQKQLAETQDAIKRLKVAIHENEVTIKANLQKIARHQQQLDQASGKKEYDALRSEIEHEQRANRALENETLEAMLALDEKIAQLPELEQALQQAQADYCRAEAELTDKQASRTQRLTELEAALRTAEAGLSPDLRAQYDRLVQAHGADALAPVRDHTCTGCYTEITPQSYQDLRAGRVVACKNCGRLLYLAE